MNVPVHLFEGYASANKGVNQEGEIHAFQAPKKWLQQKRVRMSKGKFRMIPYISLFPL